MWRSDIQPAKHVFCYSEYYHLSSFLTDKGETGMNMRMWFVTSIKMLAVVCAVMAAVTVNVQAEEGFFDDVAFEPGIPSPDEVLGFAAGSRPVRHLEAMRYMLALAKASPRVMFVDTGETYEGRRLPCVIVSSEENMRRLDAIKADIKTLADPRRGATPDELNHIYASTPAMAFTLYSIHGNEVSGTDAGLQVAYRLAAGTDETSRKIRDELVVGIYPMQNPDGRERFLSQMEQWGGNVPNSDGQSIHHLGVWPNARTNHYLFDLNRDWFILAHPETRARVTTLLDWMPQVVIDVHEMGQYDTYLFNPPREPLNTHIHPTIRNWWRTFAADQSKAFDRHGWSYYTREWLEDWYPGYTTSWADCIGAVGIIYEQAYTAGSSVRRPDGTELTFRDTVQRHIVSAFANLSTAANNRRPLLESYRAMKEEAVKPAKGAARAYYIDPGLNPSRAADLAGRLTFQGIEVAAASGPFTLEKAVSYWNGKPSKHDFPAGTFIIRLDQPLSPLAKAVLEFDPRMLTSYIESEREYLEKGKGSRMYEDCAWTPLMSFGLDAWQSAETPPDAVTLMSIREKQSGVVTNPSPGFGYLIDYADDTAIDALTALFEAGVKVRSAKEPFTVEGRSYTRGTLLVRRHENADDIGETVARIARETGARAMGVSTALSESGPDLGGREFQLLEAPRIAILTGPEISNYSFGSIWYFLDHDLGARYSILDVNGFAARDLRKYNVLILPATWGGSAAYRTLFGSAGLKKLRDWVGDGGTLIGIDTGAAFLADSTSGMSAVRLRRQVLGNLDRFEAAVVRERTAGTAVIDSVALWDGITLSAEQAKEKKAPGKNGEQAKKAPSDPVALAEQDARDRVFRPRGAILRVDLTPEHWLSFGAGDRIPAITSSTYAYLSREPVEPVGRFAEGNGLRLSGLLWPEARYRIERSAWVTRERVGNGQMILFAGEPIFRAFFYGTGRIFTNSIFLGPGFGAGQPVPW